MSDFLLWIGLYNLIGSIMLMAMHFEKIADILLRRATEIIAEPYLHGAYGRLWLWWAATMNLFVGVVMLLATRWEKVVQQEIILAVVGIYVLMYLVMVFGGRKPKYGSGIYVTHVLWLIQIVWGIYTFLHN